MAKQHVKQYTVSPAYTGNDKITTYTDGKHEGYSIVSYWETQGYCERLEEEGYTKAYDLDKLLKKMEEAKEEYEMAKRWYKEALPFALVKSEKTK